MPVTRYSTGAGAAGPVSAPAGGRIPGPWPVLGEGPGR